MKKFMRIMVLALAAMMLLCMTVSVFADETSGTTGGEPTEPTTTPTITIKGTVKDKEYRLYRVFALEYSGSGSDLNVSYTITTNWKDFFEGTDALGAKYLAEKNNAENSLPAITVGSETKYINITDANVSEFAQDALAYAAARTSYDHVKGNGTDTQVTGLPLGYYLIYPVGATEKLDENGSICSLTSKTPNGEVNIKATYPTFKKEVEDIKIEGGVSIGQNLPYKLTGKVPDTTGFKTYTYEFSDTMTDGLTFNDGSVKVYIGDGESAEPLGNTYYTYTKVNNGFKLNINVMALIADDSKLANIGDAIVVKYTATVNDKAVSVVSKNKAILTYSSDPGIEDKTETTPPQEVKVFSAKIVIDKHDANHKTVKLAGAKFALKNEAGEYYKYTAASEDGTTPAKVEWVKRIVEDQATVVTTDDKGAAKFDGLVNGTYYLEETEAPAGYNKLTNDVEVIINGNSDDVYADLTESASVENSTGSLLPSAGGIGTTVFYVVGGLLVVGAAVLLVTKRRMNADK